MKVSKNQALKIVKEHTEKEYNFLIDEFTSRA